MSCEKVTRTPHYQCSWPRRMACGTLLVLLLAVGQENISIARHQMHFESYELRHVCCSYGKQHSASSEPCGTVSQAYSTFSKNFSMNSQMWPEPQSCRWVMNLYIVIWLSMAVDCKFCLLFDNQSFYRCLKTVFSKTTIHEKMFAFGRNSICLSASLPTCLPTCISI